MADRKVDLMVAMKAGPMVVKMAVLMVQLRAGQKEVMKVELMGDKMDRLKAEKLAED